MLGTTEQHHRTWIGQSTNYEGFTTTTSMNAAVQSSQRQYRYPGHSRLWFSSQSILVTNEGLKELRSTLTTTTQTEIALFYYDCRNVAFLVSSSQFLPPNRTVTSRCRSRCVFCICSPFIKTYWNFCIAY
jgi:hypothetical protein